MKGTGAARWSDTWDLVLFLLRDFTDNSRIIVLKLSRIITRRWILLHQLLHKHVSLFLQFYRRVMPRIYKPLDQYIKSASWSNISDSWSERDLCSVSTAFFSSLSWLQVMSTMLCMASWQWSCSFREEPLIFPLKKNNHNVQVCFRKVPSLGLHLDNACGR